MAARQIPCGRQGLRPGTAGPGERVVKADGFFLGLYSTHLAADEILTQVRIPVPAAGSGWSYQ